MSTTKLMGLGDLFKEAFSAPALERSSIDSERETPIDRWMGWSTKANTENEVVATASPAIPENFVDSMDSQNYLTVRLPKPMGITFEENDDKYQGIFVLSLSPEGAAAKDGSIKPGDQLVAVEGSEVHGLPFDDALGKIIECEGEDVGLVLFRGDAGMLYGPTGASKEWLSSFISEKSAVKAA